MSYYKGIEYGKKIYHKNLSKYGTREIEIRGKVINTCREYAYNSKIRETKHG